MAEIDYDALAQAFDTTFGRSSTPKAASYSVKTTLLGPDRMLMSYAAIVHFGTEKAMIQTKRAYADESKAIVAATLKTVKGNYKQLTGSSLTTKEVSSEDNLEIIGMNVHTPRRSAYYRRRVVYEIG